MTASTRQGFLYNIEQILSHIKASIEWCLIDLSTKNAWEEWVRGKQGGCVSGIFNRLPLVWYTIKMLFYIHHLNRFSFSMWHWRIFLHMHFLRKQEGPPGFCWNWKWWPCPCHSTWPESSLAHMLVLQKQGQLSHSSYRTQLKE